MRNLLVVAALGLTLAACDNAAEESDDPAPAATETVASEETMAGTYEFEVEGTVTTAVLLPDGSYTDSQNGAVLESGMWAEQADDSVCFDPAGDDTETTCFQVGETGPDGTFVATPDDGSDPLTIRKVG